MSVAEFQTFNAAKFTRQDVWAYIGAAESNSTHPIAKALSTASKIHGSGSALFGAAALDFASTAGRGISCVVNGVRVLVGNSEFMIESGVNVTEVRRWSRGECRCQACYPLFPTCSHHTVLCL